MLNNRITKNIPGKVSFTFDTWTSEAGDPYLLMMGHYISSSKEHPQDWKLKSEQLSFTYTEGNHSGANLGGILIRTIDKYAICAKVSVFKHFVCQISYLYKKIGWFTANNASNNFSAIREVGRQLKDDFAEWDPKQHYIQ